MATATETGAPVEQENTRYTATANKAAPWTPQFKAFGQHEAWDNGAIMGFHLPTDITKAAIKNQRPQREQQISTRLTDANQSLGTPSSSSSCLSGLLLPFLLSRPGTKGKQKSYQLHCVSTTDISTGNEKSMSRYHNSSLFILVS
jgi:hypothetical protein